MFRYAFSIAVILGVAGCSDEPAGGYGPFDQPPQAPVFRQQPAIVPVPEDEFGRIGNIESPRPAEDSDAALARSVTGALGLETSTLQDPSPRDAVGLENDMGIDPNDDTINLSLSSQEVQKREREVAARRRAEARENLVVVQPQPVQQQDVTANVVKFARETTNPVGTKVYNRPAFRSRTQSASVCRRFESTDEAQRQFLSNGGPQTDRFNLDPDGDGFACGFDPEPYRNLKF